MRRSGDLWNRLTDWDNLVLAARKAQRGKRARLAVQAFNFAQESALLRVHDELERGTYVPGEYRSRRIQRPKPRLISAAPYRDRVVHHALMNILEPILERRFHPHSYACRRGRGTHAAVDRLQALMRRHRYVLQCDVFQFFPSIDHAALKGAFRRVIKDRRVLELMDLIVDSRPPAAARLVWQPGDDLFAPLERPCGLPIGNLTSQWFANWMLTGLDHHVTSRLGLGAYVRYCDDFLVLADDRRTLRSALVSLRAVLASIRLQLHPRKVFVRPVHCGVTFVGYRVWPTHRLVRKANIRAFRRRVRWMKRRYATGALDWNDVKIRLASWIGHARCASSARLLRRLSREWVFRRGSVAMSACAAGRLVEQRRNEPALREPQQQHAGQSEQQQRVPSGPALPALVHQPTRNRAFHGARERGSGSPGAAPVLCGRPHATAGRICDLRAGGAGRPRAERPVARDLAMQAREAALRWKRGG